MKVQTLGDLPETHSLVKRNGEVFVFVNNDPHRLYDKAFPRLAKDAEDYQYYVRYSTDASDHKLQPIISGSMFKV